MIQKIGLKNYKAFRDYNEIEIKPITILVGPNSSGKSALLKFLQNLQPSSQEISINRYPLSNIFNISNTFLRNNKPIELMIEFNNGNRSFKGFYNFSSAGVKGKIKSDPNLDQKIKSGSLEFQDGKYAIVRWGKIKKEVLNFLETKFPEEMYLINSMLSSEGNYPYYNLELVIDEILMWSTEGDYAEWESLSFLGDFFQVDIGDLSPAEVIIDNLNQARKNLRREADKYKILYENINGLGDDLDELLIRFWRDDYKEVKRIFNKILQSIDQENLLENKKSISIINILSITICSLLLEKFCQKHLDRYKDELKNIGYDLEFSASQNIIWNKPLRSFPQTYYTINELKEAFGLDRYEKAYDNGYSNLISKINELLKLLEFRYSFVLKVIKHNDLDEILYVVKIEDVSTGLEYNINDVGFGLSQIIPIIFSICINKENYSRNNLTIIEQPEIHLHPKQQAKLSALFISDSSSTLYNNEDLPFDGSDFTKVISNYYIIETHSEHFVRGFQLLIAQGKLRSEDIAVYYFSRDNKGVSRINNMKLNAEGLFESEWPEGFFDQQYKLAKEILFAEKE